MLFVCHRTVSMTAVYQLKIKYDQDKLERFFRCIRHGKKGVSFPLEDKHIVNEHHVIRKSHDATEKKMSSRGAFHHVIGLKQTRGIKNVTLNAAKKFVGVAVYWE